MGKLPASSLTHSDVDGVYRSLTLRKKDDKERSIGPKKKKPAGVSEGGAMGEDNVMEKGNGKRRPVIGRGRPT